MTRPGAAFAHAQDGKSKNLEIFKTISPNMCYIGGEVFYNRP